MSACVFCNDLPKLLENKLAFAVYDIKPITPGHTLIIVKRHIEQIFDATPEEITAIFDLVNQAKIMLDKQQQPLGYNVHINCGSVAGQIVMHAHVHLIPRYQKVL